ncbi:Vacuole effluxer Atg22-like protein [Aureococcus anophagefferens]|nr:Vacuole effluxer Atg22-like protein [Aureococcus anophagefferens]
MLLCLWQWQLEILWQRASQGAAEHVARLRLLPAPRAGAEPEPLLRDRRAPRPAMGYLTLGTWRVAASASYLWDNLCAGCVLSTNIFFNIALLKLATIAAGCRPEGNDDDGACAHAYA